MFKADFKYYKSRQTPPNFKDVLNFDKDITNKVKSKKSVRLNQRFFGLIPPDEWEIYEIISNPGLVFIKNPFTNLGQRYWIVRCTAYYTQKPNKTNIDVHNLISQDENWWECAQSNKELLTKLRWVTLGYHHNWDTKIYSEASKSEFPPDLARLCQFFSKVIGFESFNAEAAIVNYYHMDSTLSGHTDHSEKNLEAPLFSFSFGQTALFLIGGETIDAKPTALFLQSGDVVVMSGQSRLCYHGVPRILPCNKTKWQDIIEPDSNVDEYIDKEVLNLCLDDTRWKSFDQYMDYSRININVRQVLVKGETKLC